MKIRYSIVVLIIIVFVSLILWRVNKSNSIKEDLSLKNSILRTVQNSDEIYFSQITNFKWDTMYIFNPYSDPKDILRNNGVKIYNNKFNIEVFDNINMIGFVYSDKLVGYVELPRNCVEVEQTDFIKFSREETKFNILKDKRAIIFKN